MVTQDLDEGVTRIDIEDSVRNITGFDDPPTVSLQVTDEIVEEGGARIKPQFKATENDYRNYATDPDGGYEANAVVVESLDDMMEGTTRVMEEYATGKKTKLSRGEGRIIEAEIRAEQAAESAAEMADDLGDFE